MHRIYASDRYLFYLLCITPHPSPALKVRCPLAISVAETSRW